MSRENDLTEGNYLEAIGVPFSTGPCTLACWVYPFGSSFFDCFAVIKKGASPPNGGFTIGMQIGNAWCDVWDNSGGPAHTPITRSGATNNAWNHLGCVFETTTLRNAWMNGVKGTDHTTSISWPTGLTHTQIGSLVSGGNDTAMDGRVAECGAWDVALSDEDMGALAAGESPLMVRPESLQGYWPLFGQFGRD